MINLKINLNIWLINYIFKFLYIFKMTEIIKNNEIINLNNNLNNNYNTSNYNNNITNEKYYIDNCHSYIINVLLSLDNYIIYDNINNDNTIIKCIFRYNLIKFINILLSILYKEYNIKFYYPYNTLTIITICFNNKIYQTIYLYNITINNYMLKFTECSFDCNLLLQKFNGNIIMKHRNEPNNYLLKYNDIAYRKHYKRFCYIYPDFNDIINIDLISYKFNKLNKLIYAKKLINLGWIMDEYICKNNSWTINYWLNYKVYLNLIKFKNCNKITDTCYYCNKKFIDNDIVFNNNDNYSHYKCIFTRLCN